MPARCALLARNNPRCRACGASRRVGLHRMPERSEPITVKAKPFGRAMRGLDGFELGEAPTTLLANVGSCLPKSTTTKSVTSWVART